jgi:hypothetical protein
MALYDDDIRYPDANLAYETIDLDIIKLAVQQTVSRELMTEHAFGTPVTVDVDENSAFNHVVIRVISRRLAKQGSSHVPTGSESVPITWWDHLLITIGLKKYAKTRRITTHATIYRTCPHLNIPIRSDSDRNTHLTYLMRVDEERGRRA